MEHEKIINLGKELISTEAEALKILASNLDKDFALTVEAILNCSGKIIFSGMGKSGYIARKIASTITSLGMPAMFLHPAEASHGDMGIVRPNDVIIILSNGGESQEIYDLLDFANHQQNQVIAITAQKKSTLYKKSHIRILIPQLGEGTPLKAPLVSTSLMLACGDAIAASLIKILNITDNEFKKFHPGGKIGATLLIVKDIMRSGKNMPVVYHDQNMSETLLEMTKKSLGCTAVISKNGELVGIVTDGDLRRHMSPDLPAKKVSEVMNQYPKIIAEDELVIHAMQLMNKLEITSLFVVRGNKPKGVIHMHDCIKLGLKQADEE